jgi:hypothetical protein
MVNLWFPILSYWHPSHPLTSRPLSMSKHSQSAQESPSLPISIPYLVTSDAFRLEMSQGIPGEIVPAMDHLRIQEYSNGAYWRFVPYLDSVHRVLESLTPENTVLTSSARTSKPSLKVCMRLMIKGFIPCGLTVSKSSMGLWRKK